MSEAEQTAWHALTADEAVQRLKGSVTAGLDDSEATRRQAEYGFNVLPTARKRGPFMRFLQQRLCAARRRLHQADDEPVAGRLDHPRRGHH
jgi:magnesium-transporting ATPase (P-type)